uniref:1-acylglycerol-3-phosphate O-acyltransferase n=1 Tax=Pan paniscus TaxID=9597 RepID=A0A2R9CJN2_PANPA
MSTPGHVVLLPEEQGTNSSDTDTSHHRAFRVNAYVFSWSLQASHRTCSMLQELVMLLEWWSGTECTIFTDPRAYLKYGKENAIVVLNHKFEIDFLCGWSLSERFGLLGGSKVLAKKELAYVPIIGWMWYFTEMVFCSRKWEQDRKTVAASLQHLRDYPEKYFFLIHCEGTRFTEKKHEISMQVARAKGLPRLKHHLLPRTKGFAITVRSLRNFQLYMTVHSISEIMKIQHCWES